MGYESHQSPQKDPAENKVTVLSVRVPQSVYDRLMHLKNQYGHSDVPSTKLLLQAVTLYVAMGEEFGLDEKFKVKHALSAKADAEATHKKHTKVRLPQSA